LVTDVDVLEKGIQFLRSGKKVALCTVIEKRGSGPRDVGAKIVVTEDGEVVGTIGGGNMERILVEEALKSVKEGKSRRIVFSLHGDVEREGVVKTGLICGGEITIFIDVIEPKPRLIIIGSGHIGYPLAKLADILGFEIVIVDDNRELATKERFPMAKEILVGDFTKILDKIEVQPHDYVVIVYGEPEHDYLALKKMLEKGVHYIGLLGSKVKVGKFKERLKNEGVSDDVFRNIYAPVGLDIGAQTPEEIGISVLAQIIKIRRLKKA